MFGTLRFVLASLVIMYHLADYHPAGWYSVYAFYALSGYLMTLVISKKYPLSVDGVLSFEFNRALRIYPPYLIVLLATILALQLPSFVRAAAVLCPKPPLTMPSGAFSWFQNIFIYGWQPQTVKLLPHAWSISRELVLCSTIFFLFARLRWIALGWWILSVCYALFTLTRGYPFFNVYNSYKTAALAYSMGCCLFHFRKQLRPLAPPTFALIASFAVLPFLNEAVNRFAFHDRYALLEFYINIFLSAYMILLLSSLREKESWLQKCDNFLGNISYPMFLCHWMVGILISAIFFATPVYGSHLLAYSTIPILLVAWLINRHIERRLVEIRRRTISTKVLMARVLAFRQNPRPAKIKIETAS